MTPQFPPERQRALRAIDSTATTRVFVQCRNRFWEEEGLSGAALTDLPIMSIRHATDMQSGARGILESFSGGGQVRRLVAMAPGDRLESVIADMTRVHPRLPEYAEGGSSVAWGNDPWALGANPHFKAGQIEEFFPYIQRPEGRVHFAGDVISGLPGWMQGALTSGQMAAAAINALG